MYFKKEWHGFNLTLNIKEQTYYVDVYPLDIDNNDELCIRVYKDTEHTDECGNGIWLDSDFGTVTGNDELHFVADTDLNEFIEQQIIDEVQLLLQKEGVL